MLNKKKLFVGLAVATTLLAAGCTKKEDPEPTPTPTPTPEVTPTPTPTPGDTEKVAWDGTYAKDGATDAKYSNLTIKLSDDGKSFTFNMEANDEEISGSIKDGVATINEEDNVKAVYEGDKGFKLTFTFADGKISILSEGTSPTGISYDGVYSLEV